MISTNFKICAFFIEKLAVSLKIKFIQILFIFRIRPYVCELLKKYMLYNDNSLLLYNIILAKHIDNVCCIIFYFCKESKKTSIKLA